jgi:hypothetical protein
LKDLHFAFVAAIHARERVILSDGVAGVEGPAFAFVAAILPENVSS